MTGSSGEFLQAVYGLRKAAEAEFSGNTYYRVANHIAGVIELVGWGDGGGVPLGNQAAYGFATSLAAVRKQLEASASGNRFSLIANQLDELAPFVSEAAPAAVEKPAVPAAAPAAPKPDFEALAEASKARVEDIAKSLGVATATHAPAAHLAETPNSAKPELMQALFGLRKAAEAQFTGNVFYGAANRIGHLIELVGWNPAGAPVGQSAAYGFATVLASVRQQADAGVCGNHLGAISETLDELAALMAPPSPAKEKTANGEAVSEKRAAAIAMNAPAAAPAVMPAVQPAGPKPTFADLAAASKARVEDVAKSLGISMAHPVAHTPAVELPAAGELERRSSEPCAMAELAPVILEPVAAAAIPAEAASAQTLGKADAHPGSPAAQSEAVAAQGTGSLKGPEAAIPAEVQPAAPAHDTAAVAAGQAVTEDPPVERRLESRSSEVTAPALESARVPSEAAPEPNPAEAAFYLGSPAAESDASLEEESVREDIAAAEAAAQPAVREPAPAYAATVPSAGLAASGEKPEEAKPKKTLFKLWLDLAFGRKD
ncbi:MAG: hypothetical protein ACLPIX_02315 [Rhodomicrobium sp.]